MSDVMVSSEKLLERLGREELQLKQHGLVNQAAGMRCAIVALIKEIHAARQPMDDEPPLEPAG
jgi:hypothetical protein